MENPLLISHFYLIIADYIPSVQYFFHSRKTAQWGLCFSAPWGKIRITQTGLPSDVKEAAMTKKKLFVLWGGMFILCAGLGFIPGPTGALRVLLSAVSLAFFVPPGLLLYRAAKTGDRATVVLIRNLAALSLILTAVLLVLNFLAVLSTEAAGTMLYYMLVMVSSPMICSGNWAVSLFLWACLLMAALKYGRK